jgi:tetratricopeptide repeat protein
VNGTTLLIALLIFGTHTASAQDQHEHGAPATRLGRVHFSTSCSPAVQNEFDRGVALLHSFWFSAAIDTFKKVLVSDPACAMAEWGIAMSWWSNPFGGFRSAQALANGAQAVERAKSIGLRTDRERAYVEAVETLYASAGSVDQRTRTVNYEKAMERLSAAYPDDTEARIFYALALDQTALLTDKTYANQLKAAAILEKEFASQPQHPGLAHYIIHSFDFPPLAPRALEAARAYAKIAPDAPHALHMPSHTFTRVGYWQESIDTNRASAAAARRDNAPAEELHALDYQMYAYLQTAQDAAARRSLEAIGSIGPKIQMDAPGAAAPPPAGYYAMAAIPARYALERAAWRDAAALTPTRSPFAWADAVTHFARGLGAARTGDANGASREADQLAELRDALEKAKDTYWTEQVNIQERVVRAWAAIAEGRSDAALAGLREAAEREDATEKSAVTPGPIKPARELLGEMLLEMKRPADALKEFEAVMTKEPNRFRATYGAAQAALAAGDRAKATRYFTNVVKLCDRADSPGRPELQESRRLAAAR